MTMKKNEATTKQLEDALNVIRAQATEGAKEQVRIARLAEQALTIARGTGDVGAQARAAVEALAEAKLPARIRAAILERGPTSVIDLSKLLAEPAARVQRAVKTLRAAGKLRNVGNETSPAWWWPTGDEGDTGELRDSVERLLRFKPMTLVDLVEATGARRNRISGVLVKLQVRGLPVRNLGTGQRAVWFIGAGPRRTRG